MGVLGSCVATFAVVLPSFILMLTISKFFLKYQKHPAVEAVFSGLRPAVVGLLASAGADEHGELQFAPGRYVLFHHQYHHLPCSFHRNKKI